VSAPRRGFDRRETVNLLGLLGGLLVVMQLLPVGARRENPPVVAGPTWDSERTRELFMHSCRDCHSNETRWPWYSAVAPMRWLVAHDVAEGREHLNVSEWHRPQRHADEAAKEVREGEMPLRSYLWFHPEARLGAAERRDLVAGLAATFGEEDEREDGDRRREDARRGRDD